MKLPYGNLTKLVGDSTRIDAMGKLSIAYRHHKLWVYATDGKALARAEIEVGDDELKELYVALSEKGGDPNRCAILVDVETYTTLRKGKAPIAIDLTGAQPVIRQRGKNTMFAVELDPDARLPEMIEQILVMERDRTELGTLHFDPRLPLLCLDAIAYDDKGNGIASVEVAPNLWKPWIMRNGANVAVFMPARDTAGKEPELPGLKALIDTAKAVLNLNGAVDDPALPATPVKFAELVLKTFGVTFAE